MQIEVKIDTGGQARAGIDHKALVDNIKAELDKFAAATGAVVPDPIEEPAPQDAQGDLSALQWIIDVATDPVLAKTYAKALVYAINTIITAATVNNSVSKSSSTDSKMNSTEKSVVKINLLGKELALPLAASVIKKILESIED